MRCGHRVLSQSQDNFLQGVHTGFPVLPPLYPHPCSPDRHSLGIQVWEGVSVLLGQQQ